MNVLWIGSINWLTENGYVLEAKTAGAVSSSSFEQTIIEGLEALGHDVRILTDMDNDRGERFEWSHNNISKDICVAGISTKYLRLFYKAVQLNKELYQNATLLDGIDIAIIYSVHVPYFTILSKLQKHNIRVILICPDLSEYMDPAIEHKHIKKILRHIESGYVHKKIAQFDGYVWFSKQMGDFFEITRNSVVVEGVCSEAGLEFSSHIAKKKYAMYAGSLSSNFGIQNVMEAFNSLQDLDLELWIFGTGELEKDIVSQSHTNHKIIFKGFVPRKELFSYEREAMFLINARDPKEEYTKYSFPSKTFEYLLSGTPFLTTKLEGIPSEYDPYLLYVNSNDPSELANAIRKVYYMSEKQRNDFGDKAKHFVLEKKNGICQSKKIEQLMNRVTQC